MDAPKKIYLQVCGDCPQTDCDNCKFSDLEDNVTWCKDRIFNKDIEYIRTDSFVEKVTKLFEENLKNLGFLKDERESMVNMFKKAMKQ